MNVLSIASEFQISDNVVGYYPLGNGHINTTFLITTNGGQSYVLQKINTNVFKDVDKLMDNIYKVTDFLRKKGYDSLEIVKAKDNKLYYSNKEGCFRLYIYINNAVCYEGVKDLDAIYNAGKAFGTLHRYLNGFPAETLFEIIPDFHNTQKRYEVLLAAITSDSVDRVKKCENEIQVLKRFEHEYNRINELIDKGEVKLAVTHNDPKINNVLIA